jgi:hypothetical protein
VKKTVDYYMSLPYQVELERVDVFGRPEIRASIRELRGCGARVGGGDSVEKLWQRSQLQPGDPAFRPLFQLCNILRRQIKPHYPLQESRGLLPDEGQFGCVELGYLVSGAQS